WSLAPVVIAVLLSFNAGRSPGAWQGFSLRWYYKDPVLSVWHDPTYRSAIFQTLRLAILTTLVAVPIGVAFAIVLDRLRAPASPTQAIRRVLLPLLYPAIFASVVLVFADCIDDFVIVRYLSSTATTEPMSVQIYDSARSAPTPALNALATIMLVSSLIAVTGG